ncbi:MAG: 2-vinyl bacteriochlorophyllide hydratase [Pseudomonadota bacterium]
MFSIAVLALHTAYLLMVGFHVGSADQQMLVALTAYAAYVINAGQFLLKLRRARLETGQAAHVDGFA